MDCNNLTTLGLGASPDSGMPFSASLLALRLLSGAVVSGWRSAGTAASWCAPAIFPVPFSVSSLRVR